MNVKVALPVITGILFVGSIVLAIIDPQRALVFAVLFVGCVADPINQNMLIRFGHTVLDVVVTSTLHARQELPA